MTTSDWTKVFKQLRVKPEKLKKYKKHNAPKARSCGKVLKKCKLCGSYRGHIDSYGLNMCRKCFRDIATKIGFRKYS